MPKTSYIFLLRGTGIVLVLFYIYPIVPYAPAFSHSFLSLVTVAKGIGLKPHIYIYSVVLELFLCSSLYSFFQSFTNSSYSFFNVLHYSLFIALVLSVTPPPFFTLFNYMSVLIKSLLRPYIRFFLSSMKPRSFHPYFLHPSIVGLPMV